MYSKLYNNNVLDLINELNNRLIYNQDKQKQLIDDISKLPKGHINILYRSNKGYYYLTYREGKKIVNKYIGVVGKTNIDDILKMISDRQQYKDELKQLKQEEKLLKRIIK